MPISGTEGHTKHGRKRTPELIDPRVEALTIHTDATMCDAGRAAGQRTPMGAEFIRLVEKYLKPLRENFA